MPNGITKKDVHRKVQTYRSYADALTSFKGGNLISAEEKQHNEIIYLAALSVLRKLCADGGVVVEVAERINQKNAEKMGCTAIPIG